MARRPKPEEVPVTDPTTTPEALPVTETVTEQPTTAATNGQPANPGSTFPTGERRDPPGDKPVMKFGPFPTSEKRTHLSVAVWRREVTDPNTGEIYAVYNVGLSRTYYNGGPDPKTSSTIRASEIPLAIMMLETASRWIADQKPS